MVALNRANVVRAVARAISDRKGVLVSRHPTSNQVILWERGSSRAHSSAEILALDDKSEVTAGDLPIPNEVSVGCR